MNDIAGERDLEPSKLKNQIIVGKRLETVRPRGYLVRFGLKQKVVRLKL